MAGWNGRARDWAEAQEPAQRPFFEAVLQRAAITSGQSLLDIGCGAGLFLSMAAQQGAVVSGIDGSAGMLEVARERLPQADLRQGDMTRLPFDDECFDVVTGFNSFQFAPDPVLALREARRVAKRHAKIFVLVWANPALCDAAQPQLALRSFAPPPQGSVGAFSLSGEELLRQVAARAGLGIQSLETIDGPFEFPDLDTAVRGALAGSNGARAIEAAGEEAAREVVIRVLTRFRTANGGVHMHNRFLLMVIS